MLKPGRLVALNQLHYQLVMLPISYTVHQLHYQSGTSLWSLCKGSGHREPGQPASSKSHTTEQICCLFTTYPQQWLRAPHLQMAAGASPGGVNQGSNWNFPHFTSEKMGVWVVRRPPVSGEWEARAPILSRTLARAGSLALALARGLTFPLGSTRSRRWSAPWRCLS